MSLVVLKIERTRHGANTTMGTMSISWPFGGRKSIPHFAYTLELPWKGNRANVSCIPPGRYPAKVRTDKNKWRLELMKTGPREHVEIHIGNSTKDVIGCILIGKTMGADFVGNSEAAIKALRAEIEAGKPPIEISVEIKDPYFNSLSARNRTRISA
jgi:Family of unknown function (DUF5675)